MSEVTVRMLRNHGGEVLDRVARGETLTVTKDGVEMAELRPLPRPGLRPSELVARRQHLPRVDPDQLRRDLDSVIDPTL